MSVTVLRMEQLLPVDESTKDVNITQGRILFGSADVCGHRSVNYRVPLAAMAACYGGNWFLHDLRACRILCDGAEIKEPTPLIGGQYWHIGPFHFQVQKSSPLPKLKSPQPRCSIYLEGALESPTQLELASEFLLGTAASCDLPSPSPLGLASRHALIAGLCGEWYIHDLSGHGGQCNGIAFADMCQLFDADIVNVGPVSLRVLCPSRPSGDKLPVVASSITQSQTPPSGYQPRQGMTSLVTPEANLRALAQTVYNQLKTAHTYRTPEEINQSLSARWRRFRRLRSAESYFVQGLTAQAMCTVRDLLDEAPFDTYLILSFARMCDACQLDSLCFLFLQQLLKLRPNDGLVLRALARVTQHLGDRDPRFLKVATTYWKHIAELFPAEKQAIGRTINGIEARQYLTALDAEDST